MKSDAIILIVGPPRSGTTMLNNLLCYEALPECSTITKVIQQYKESLLYLDGARFSAYFHDKDGARRVFSEMVAVMVESCRQGIEEPLVLKDPELTRLLPWALELFPENTKLITIVRDPRDVLSSMKAVQKRKGLRWNIVNMCEWLYPYYQSLLQFENSRPGQTLLLRYEDVVMRSPSAIDALSSFAQRTLLMDGSATRHDKSDPFYSEKYGKPVTADSVGQYRKSLRGAEITLVNSVFSEVMKHWGYASGPKVSVYRIAYVFRPVGRALGRVARELLRRNLSGVMSTLKRVVASRRARREQG